MSQKRKKPSLILTRQQAEQFSSNELEVMKRLLENQPPELIQQQLGLTPQSYTSLVTRPRWVQEFEVQALERDREIRPRLESLSSEALDTVRDIMRNAASPSNRLRAALEILDRSGYVKIEKRIQVNADAEAIIRELNKANDPIQVALDVSPEALDEFDAVAEEVANET